MSLTSFAHVLGHFYPSARMEYLQVSPVLAGISSLGSVYHETYQGPTTRLSVRPSLHAQTVHHAVLLESHLGDRVVDDRRTKIDRGGVLPVMAKSL